MSYTDAELKNATQVAYTDLQIGFDAMIQEGKTPPFYIKDLLKYLGKDKNTIDKAFPDLDGVNIDNWKIVDYYDHNGVGESGCYGCAIDTGNGNLIVAFRGSESMMDLENAKQDWVDADLGLINSTSTEQQYHAEMFIKQISESDYIKNYHSITPTGHSLGGNLAEHATIMSVKYGLDHKIDRCVSYDGPGYSDEYLNDPEKMEYLSKVKDKMTHYQWSLVGGLLPGVEYITLKVKEKDPWNLGYYLFGKHSTTSLIFDEDGNAVRGEASPVDIIFSLFSQGIDRLPTPISNTIRDAFSELFLGVIWLANEITDKDDDGNLRLNLYGYGLLAGIIGVIFKVGFIASIKFVAAVILAVIGFVIVIAAFELFAQMVEQFVDFLADAYEWVKEKYDEIKDYIKKQLEKIKKWFNENFNSGYKEATRHPSFKLDTEKMRTYSDRLSKVNSRITKVDRRLDSLYWKVGLFDLWNLMQADLLTGYSVRVLACATALDNTASDYEKNENKLKNTL